MTARGPDIPLSERVLATVLFTDIVGSTRRLSELGDQRWGELLERHHEVVRAELARHGGREVSTTGDGFVAVFDAPAPAIRCALAIRDALAPLRIEVRAGLHSGEIERHGDEIGGIAVHMAARVAALGGAGEILISRTVRDLVSGGGFPLIDLGKRQLKGVPDRWRIFKVPGDEATSRARTSSAAGLWSRVRGQRWLPAAAAALVVSLILLALFSAYRDRSGIAANEPPVLPTGPVPGRDVASASIAVLPFDNMSADEENEYFADGLAEEILNALANVPGLKVAARTSSFSFKDKDADIPTIADALGVRTVLEGSVRKSGDRVRITAQLVNAEDGLHLWSETYDRELDDIFVVQEEIARAIVDALEVRLATGAALVERPTESQEAYEEYLRGRYLWNRRNVEPLQAAVEHFERAVALDPEFALAWAGLADAYLTLPWYLTQADDWDALLESGRDAAERALAMDPDLAQAHIALGLYHASKFEWAAADEEFRRGLELDPRYSTGHYWYAYTIGPQGRLDEAIEHARIATELDPLSLINMRGYGWILMWAGRYEEALAVADRVRELDPNFAPNWALYGRLYAIQGRWQEATEAFARSHELRGWNPAVIRRAIAAMERHAETRQPVPVPGDLDMAIPRNMVKVEIISMLGQPDSVMAILQRMQDEGDPNLREVGIEPLIAPLHDDPRFVALLEKIGLAPVESARAWMKDR